VRPGALFTDRFEIERVAGSGGMGTVYRALDLRDGGRVALKLLRSEDSEGGLRFEREARLLAQLDHPGIVRCIDHGRTPEGVAWLAMEWLDGEDLGERLSRGALSCEETVALGRRVAEALAEAHGRGVVHRDVKPSNLFLPGGAIEQVKVIDFGIARGAYEGRATLSGTAVGTPSYMAPEQARGAHRVDLRADLFSLGCVLFECLAGRPPFEGVHAMAILAKLLFEEVPSLHDLVPGVPPALADLIARMLAKQPADRPAGGLEVAAGLERPGAVDAAPLRAPALTGKEQRLVSVIVAGAQAAPPVQVEADTVRLDGTHDALRTLRVALAPFDARIERLADDSLVAALAGSGGATDQAARAARCALAMRDVIPEGALALATGRGLIEADVPIGEAIDRAVALLRDAQRGGAGRRARVVLDPVTAGLLDARFVVEARGRLLELTGERDALLDAARTLLGKPIPCVGRDREIAAIESMFAECAADATSRAVLLTGAAGIGKSRVAHEVLGRVRSRGDAAAIWIARGDPMGAGSSRRLIAQMVARAAEIAPGEEPAAQRDKLRAHVAGRLQGEAAARVAEFLGELIGVPFPDEQRLQLRAARQDARLLGDQIRRAAEDLLDAECARGPVLLVLEDLHWADPPSVNFVDAALRRLAERPLMVLALARPEVHERFPRLWDERGTHAIRLGELPRKASERLARQALGDLATPAAVARVVEQSAGNAFYLEELIRAAAEGKGDAPGTVLAMVQSRLEALSPEARRVLRAGSIFGEAFWRGGVRALLGDAGASAPEDAALAELEAREIVRPRESRFPGEEEHAFRHALVREAAYGMLTRADLTTGHRLAGAWLERAGEGDAMQLAEHFERGAEPARAAAWYQRGAEQALQANDLEAVIVRAGRAAELGAEGEVLGAALLLLGEAHLWRGESAEAGPPLAKAMQLVPHGSALWFRAVMRSGWAAVNGGDRPRVISLAAELEPALGPSPSGPALIAAARTAIQLLLLGLRREADPFVARLAPVLADPACDPIVAAHAHELASIVAVCAGDAGAASVDLAASAARFDEVGDALQAARARSNAGNVLTYLGLLDQAEVELRTTLAAAERLGSHHTAAVARQSLGSVLLLQRAFPEARALEEQAIAALAAQGDSRSEGVSRAYLAAILLETGDLADAEAEASRAVALCEATPPMRCLALATLSRVLLARRRPAEALLAAREAMDTLDRLGGIEEGEALVRVTFAEALYAADELGPASAAIASARDHLLARAARITDPAWRRSFLANVPENARTLALAGELVTEAG
jgi:eukaryotic-like serine/threonine-protein kinase